MDDEVIATLTHEQMEGFISAVLDPRASMCFVYIEQQGEWQNAYGADPTDGDLQIRVRFMGNEAELHSLTVWVKEN